MRPEPFSAKLSGETGRTNSESGPNLTFLVTP
jgi:hypothetical protein